MQKKALKQNLFRAAVAIFLASATTAQAFDAQELLRVGQITDTALLEEEIERSHPLRVRRHPLSVLFLDPREAGFEEDEWQALTTLRLLGACGIFRGDGDGGVIVVLKTPEERVTLLHEFAHFLIAKIRNRPKLNEGNPASVGLFLQSMLMEEMEINQFLLKHRKELHLKPNEVLELASNIRYDANFYFIRDPFNLESLFPGYEEFANFRKIKGHLFLEANAEATAFLRADPELKTIERSLRWRNRRARSFFMFPGAYAGLLLTQGAERWLSQSTSLQDLGWTLSAGLAAALSLPPRQDTLRTPIPVFNVAFQGASRAVVVAGCVKLLESLAWAFY